MLRSSKNSLVILSGAHPFNLDECLQLLFWLCRKLTAKNERLYCPQRSNYALELSVTLFHDEDSKLTYYVEV